jgi:PhnB protein
MSNAKIEPYLHFGGNCEEVMNFYKSIFGGELEVSRFSDFAGPDQAPQDTPEGVMHSTLKSDNLSFMASDGMPEMTQVVGDNISMSISGDDEAQLTGFFNGLGEGGTVTLPLARQMWGDTFGMLTDKYGIHWMINIATRK